MHLICYDFILTDAVDGHAFHASRMVKCIV